MRRIATLLIALITALDRTADKVQSLLDKIPKVLISIFLIIHITRALFELVRRL